MITADLNQMKIAKINYLGYKLHKDRKGLVVVVLRNSDDDYLQN